MVIVTGAEGQLANALCRVFSRTEEDLLLLNREQLDISDQKAVFDLLTRHKPNWIINCAAYNKVEQAEEEIRDAYENNSFGPYFLAKTANDFDCKIVHVSTDYVFDGEKDCFFEDDRPNPINVYGASKLAGENLVRLANKQSFIIRTSWLFGKNKNSDERNFVKTIIDKAKQEKIVRVVEDQVGSPTYTNDLADKIKQFVTLDFEPGIYHVTNSGFCSWYEFAKKIIEFSGIDAEVVPIKTNESGTKIKRPVNSVLKNNKLKDLEPMRNWQEALNEYIQELN